MNKNKLIGCGILTALIIVLLGILMFTTGCDNIEDRKTRPIKKSPGDRYELQHEEHTHLRANKHAMHAAHRPCMVQEERKEGMKKGTSKEAQKVIVELNVNVHVYHHYDSAPRKEERVYQTKPDEHYCPYPPDFVPRYWGDWPDNWWKTQPTSKTLTNPCSSMWKSVTYEDPAPHK